MAVVVEVKYFNSFWLKKVCCKPTEAGVYPPIVDASATTALPGWPGLPWMNEIDDGYPVFPFGTRVGTGTDPAPGPSIARGFAEQGGDPGEQKPWFVEDMWIKGGFNNTPLDLGVKAYIVEPKRDQENLFHSLIYSGIFNSRTGVNNTNVFSVGENITKSVDPINGSIQKLYAEDTNLIIWLSDLKIKRLKT